MVRWSLVAFEFVRIITAQQSKFSLRKLCLGAFLLSQQYQFPLSECVRMSLTSNPLIARSITFTLAAKYRQSLSTRDSLGLRFQGLTLLCITLLSSNNCSGGSEQPSQQFFFDLHLLSGLNSTHNLHDGVTPTYVFTWSSCKHSQSMLGFLCNLNKSGMSRKIGRGLSSADLRHSRPRARPCRSSTN